MFKNLSKTLSQLHPGYSDLRVYFRTILGIGVTVFLILSIFQPFNLHDRNINNSPLLTALVYAGGAFLTMLASTVWIRLFPRVFAPENWTLGRELGIIVYQMASVAGTVWLINHLRGTMLPGGGSYWRTLLIVFATGILPYMIITFIRHNYLLKKNLRQAREFQLTGGHTTTGEMKDAPAYLNIPRLLEPVSLASFYYAESRGNNLHIVCLKNGAVTKHYVRCTISEFESDNAGFGQLLRCHRSFIINCDKIMTISGNATGYQVLLHPDMPAVIVSRSKVDHFRKAMAAQKNAFTAASPAKTISIENTAPSTSVKAGNL